MEFTKLEGDILNWIIDHIENPILEEQLNHAIPVKRDYTGSGFFVHLFIPDNIPSLPYDEGDVDPFPGPMIVSEQLEAGGDTVIFVTNGKIDCLELFAYGNTFPEHLENFTLKD